MSRLKRSWPIPTGKTGIERAFRLASGSSSDASDVSAPSVTITRPASGKPDSSSRARSSAWPRCVEVPAYWRSAVCARRSADDENQETQDEALRERLEQLPLLAELLLDERGAGLFVAVRNRHALRVVDEHTQEVLLRDGGLQNDGRTEQTEGDQRDERQTQGDHHGAIALRTVRGDGTVRDERCPRDDRQPEEAERRRSRGGEREIPLVEDERRILEEKSKKPAHFAPFYSSRKRHVSRPRAAKELEKFES